MPVLFYKVEKHKCKDLSALICKEIMILYFGSQQNILRENNKNTELIYFTPKLGGESIFSVTQIL